MQLQRIKTKTNVLILWPNEFCLIIILYQIFNMFFVSLGLRTFLVLAALLLGTDWDKS